MAREPRRLPRREPRPEDFAYLTRPTIGQVLHEIRQPLDLACAQQVIDPHVVIRAAERLAEMNADPPGPLWHEGERLRLRAALDATLAGEGVAAPYERLGRTSSREQAVRLHDELAAELENCDVERWRLLLRGTDADEADDPVTRGAGPTGAQGA